MVNKEGESGFLYLKIYEYYKDMILQRRLLPGSRMPSLRQCAQLHSVSRTTAENAYLQLSADGYIISKEKSGYFVTKAARREENLPSRTKELPVRYNFASGGVDRDSFRFDLWRRYLRSALRQDNRMLTYPEPQGEADLRQALASYIRRHRNILCSPDEIVIGAGTQNLLQILCPVLKEQYSTVSFPTPDFIQGAAVFCDFGFDVHYRDKNSGVIYVSPAQMTKWGEVMTVKRRIELVNHAEKDHHLVIEDDYGSEFIYLPRPAPSLFGLGNQNNTVYLGSFSRLLLPSIRLSFMILPPAMLARYTEKKRLYNQTASKAEQIALAQFIQDRHLETQIRKQRRIYARKRKTLISCLESEFADAEKTADDGFKILCGASGTTAALCLPSELRVEEVTAKARREGLLFKVSDYSKNRQALLLSCSSIPEPEIEPACKLLHSIICAS